MANDSSRPTGLNGKWLVVLILCGAALLAIIGSKFTKYRTLMPEPATTQP